MGGHRNDNQMTEGRGRASIPDEIINRKFHYESLCTDQSYLLVYHKSQHCCGILLPLFKSSNRFQSEGLLPFPCKY